jgi:hypothetical protein
MTGINEPFLPIQKLGIIIIFAHFHKTSEETWRKPVEKCFVFVLFQLLADMPLRYIHFLEFIAVLSSCSWFMDILLTDHSELQTSSINSVIQIQILLQRYKHFLPCCWTDSELASVQHLAPFSLLILDLAVWFIYLFKVILSSMWMISERIMQNMLYLVEVK